MKLREKTRLSFRIVFRSEAKAKVNIFVVVAIGFIRSLGVWPMLFVTSSHCRIPSKAKRNSISKKEFFFSLLRIN